MFNYSCVQLLMHYVDDFLLLTQDLSTARKFLEIMTNGIGQNYIFIADDLAGNNY